MIPMPFPAIDMVEGRTVNLTGEDAVGPVVPLGQAWLSSQTRFGGPASSQQESPFSPCQSLCPSKFCFFCGFFCAFTDFFPLCELSAAKSSTLTLQSLLLRFTRGPFYIKFAWLSLGKDVSLFSSYCS